MKIRAKRLAGGPVMGDSKYITLEGSKKMMAAAEAEALKNKWNVAIAIVDEAGNLIHFSKLDGTQPASIAIAIGKAKTAATFKRPTKVLEDAVAAGRSVLLSVEGITPMEGGVPVVVDGKVIGAVGVSGVKSHEDAMIARAGADALTPP